MIWKIFESKIIIILLVSSPLRLLLFLFDHGISPLFYLVLSLLSAAHPSLVSVIFIVGRDYLKVRSNLFIFLLDDCFAVFIIHTVLLLFLSDHGIPHLA